jgi:L-ascorbate metabolism protein UlaG (beta-lactamase superfamily)
MRVEWHGQSAFTLTGEEAKVFIDPFADVSALAERGIEFEYPPIEAEGVDLLLVTHEHLDHNGVEAVGGDPALVRSTPGRHETPIGEVVGIASEHDDAAGTERGANTIFVLEFDGLRIAHLGDFGQVALRAPQAAALSGLDLLFVPVGGGPTIGGALAAEISLALAPRWVVPMHYRTARTNFLETEEEFAAAMPETLRVETPSFETGDLPRPAAPLAVVPAAP